MDLRAITNHDGGRLGLQSQVPSSGKLFTVVGPTRLVLPLNEMIIIPLWVHATLSVTASMFPVALF
jgi:hypothetical protein